MKSLKVKLLAICAVLLVVSCSGKGGASKDLEVDSNANKNLAVIGENVKFDPNILINEGKPIEVEFWVWDAQEIFQAAVDGFEAIYPNVSIKVVNQPWGDYWTKLPLSIQGKKGPALFAIHNSQHDNLINNLEPYSIDLKDLTADFTGVEGHVIDGNVYYMDYGMMTGSIFYNKTMWAEAGLTEKDIPNTWDEFIEVAKKLTKFENGEMTQAGFNYNADVKAMIAGLNYQKGQLIYKEDGVTPDLNSPEMVKTIQFLKDLYDVEKVGSKDFGIVDSESFGQGQSAMIYKWGWFYNSMLNDYPDIDFGVFRIPTPTDATPFAFDRYNGESTLGISKNADAKSKEVAQAFVRYFLSNDEALKQLCIKYSIFPSKKSLATDPEIKNHPVLTILEPTVDRLIWPGPMPSVIETALQQAIEDVMYNEVGIQEAFDVCNQKVADEMVDSPFVSSESKYKYSK